MFFYGFNENDEKIYYDTRSNKITMKQLFDEEPVSENITFNSLDEELKYIGFNDSEIAKILTKMANIDNTNSNIEPVTSTNPTTGQTTTNPKGSLVSNSAQSLKNTTLYQESRMATEQAKLSLMSSANEVQKKQLDMMDYNLMVQGQILGALYDLNKNLEKLTTASSSTKEPIEGINQNLGELRGTLSSINSKFSTVEKHYGFLKDGHPDMKDSNGNVIKPREVEAKKNAEQLIEQKETNETTFGDIEEFFKEAMGQVAEGVESLLGATDGFDLEFNPLKFIDDILVKDYMEQIKKLKK